MHRFRLPALGAVLLIALPAAAIPPSFQLQQQGFLLGPGDVPVDGPTSFKVKLWKTRDTIGAGDLAWSDDFTGVMVAAGRYSITLGDTSVEGRDALATEIFGQELYLGLAIGDGPELKPRLRVGFVPAAGRALVADSALALDCAGCLTSAQLADASIAHGKLPEGAGSGLDADKLDGLDATAFARLNPASAQAGDLGVTGDLTAGAFVRGDGSKLTGLTESQFTGVLAPARLGGTYGEAVNLSNPASVFGGRFEGTVRALATAPACTSGALYFDTALTSLRVCDGSTWKPVLPAAPRLPELRFREAMLSFDVRGAAMKRTVVLENLGDAPSTGLVLAASAGYVLATTCTGSLAGKVTCNVDLTLEPTAPWGSRAGTLVASSTAGGTATVALDGAYTPLESCKAIKAAASTSADGRYFIHPTGSGQPFEAWCDMMTDSGGWTLALATRDGAKYPAGSGLWHDASSDRVPVTPTLHGKSPVYSTLTGSEVLFKTDNEAANRWASFTMPAAGTLLDLVGAENIVIRPDGSRATPTKKAQGSAAAACWNQNWNVTWRNHYSSDATPDSGIFVPSGAASGRPCGGAPSYATGIGLRTDSSNGFYDNYGGTFEGYSGEGGGAAGLTGGYIAIYVR